MTSNATVDPASTAAPSGTVRITPASAASSIPSPASGAESALDGCSTAIVQLPSEPSIPIPHADHGKIHVSLQWDVAQRMTREVLRKAGLHPDDHAATKETDPE